MSDPLWWIAAVCLIPFAAFSAIAFVLVWGAVATIPPEEDDE
jgi:hypothetical protein